MKTKLIISLILSGFVIFGAVSGFGQGNMDNALKNKALNELEKTDRAIEKAKEAVIVSRSPAGQVLYDNSVKLQNLAWTNYRIGNQQGFIASNSYTKQARGLALQALSRCRMTEQNEDQVVRRLEKINNIMERFKERLQENQSEQLRRVYETASENLKKAWEFYRNNQYRPAVKLALQIERTIRKVNQAAKKQNHQVTNLLRQIEKTGELIESIRSRIENCNSSIGVQRFEQAEKSYELCQEFYFKDKYEAAQKELQLARKFAREAEKECNSSDKLKMQMQKLQNQLDRLQQYLSNDDDFAIKLYERANDQIGNASEYIDQDKPNKAAASLKAAQLTINQLKKLLKIDDSNGF